MLKRLIMSLRVIQYFLLTQVLMFETWTHVTKQVWTRTEQNLKIPIRPENYSLRELIIILLCNLIKIIYSRTRRVILESTSDALEPTLKVRTFAIQKQTSFLADNVITDTINLVRKNKKILKSSSKFQMCPII